MSNGYSILSLIFTTGNTWRDFSPCGRITYQIEDVARFVLIVKGKRKDTKHNFFATQSCMASRVNSAYLYRNVYGYVLPEKYRKAI